jgi:hypothetical protein
MKICLAVLKFCGQSEVIWCIFATFHCELAKNSPKVMEWSFITHTLSKESDITWRYMPHFLTTFVYCTSIYKDLLTVEVLQLIIMICSNQNLKYSKHSHFSFFKHRFLSFNIVYIHFFLLQLSWYWHPVVRGPKTHELLCHFLANGCHHDYQSYFVLLFDTRCQVHYICQTWTVHTEGAQWRPWNKKKILTHHSDFLHLLASKFHIWDASLVPLDSLLRKCDYFFVV